MKKLLCSGLCLWILLGTAFALPEMGQLNAKSAALYDSSGQLLYEYNADEPLQPASVTKIMTLLLAMEALDRGEVALDEMVTGSAYAASMGGTQVWLKEGEQMPLDDMLKAIAVASANDCAVAVAEHLAGTEAAFVERMNTRAQDLGCTNTKFINANGLDHSEDKTLTSARDLALISVELLKHPKILDYTTIWMDSIRGGEFELANTNKMLRSYNGLIGLKTGYISEAGYCISAAAERDGMTLIATVMAAPTSPERMADASALLNYGFANFAKYEPDLTGVPTAIPVILGKREQVALQTGDAAYILVEKEKLTDMTASVVLPETLDAPVAAGQEIGEIIIMQGETEKMRIPVTAAEAVDRMGFTSLYREFLRVALMK